MDIDSYAINISSSLRSYKLGEEKEQERKMGVKVELRIVVYFYQKII